MFHNMEYIYSVYKERSFSKAAEKLHISQPSLSATTKKIEEQAGAPIFERKTRPVSLTPFGVAFIQGIEQVYAIEETCTIWSTSSTPCKAALSPLAAVISAFPM